MAKKMPMAGGQFHSLALRSDGRVWAWEDNSEGQLGDGTYTDRTVPVAVSGLSGVVAVAAGGDHSLAVTSVPTSWVLVEDREAQAGSTATLAAWLYSVNDAVANRQLDFSLEGTYVGSALTDASGRARVSTAVPSGTPGGFYPVNVTYGGAADLLPSSERGWLEVKQSATTLFVPDGAAPSPRP